jgi:hypothetical protein
LSRRKQSKAILAIDSYQLRTGNFEAFFAEDFFHSTQEVRHLDGDYGLGRQESSDDPFALGDLDLVALAQEILYDRETVAEVTNGGFLHVIHFSITKRS